jgi:hypothetical protein
MMFQGSRVGAASTRPENAACDVERVTLHLSQVSEVVLVICASKQRMPVQFVVSSWIS